MATAMFVLPGEHIDSSLLPSHPKKHLSIGPGLRHIPPNTISPTVAGQLCIDKKKNAVWIEYNAGRYTPAVGDLVIATIQRSATEMFYVTITDYSTNATLPQLSFEGATKKTRPNLEPGALVYARVTLANKHMDPELECVSSATGKSDGLGPLIGGMLFEVSLNMARRLMLAKPVEQGKLAILEELGKEGLAFETAVGRNGKVWVNSASIQATLAIGKALQDTDTKHLSLEAQQKLAKKLLAGL